MIESVARRWMPDRERRRAIWVIALPIMGGMMSQNVLNLVDIGMVGRLGDAALAATLSPSLLRPSPCSFFSCLLFLSNLLPSFSLFVSFFL